MELLVVTLAYTTPAKDTDMLSRIRLIADTMRNAPSLVTSRFYRGRGTNPYYLMLTTWDDEESWRQLEKRYSPKHLLLSADAELLSAPPEQWLMHYLWGYSRPSAPPLLAAAHLAKLHADQVEVAQRAWIEGSRRQAMQSELASAFLARGSYEDTSSHRVPGIPETPETGGATYHQGCVFLHLLNWANDSDREDFYAEANYQAVQRFLSSVGTIQIFPLEPM